MTTPRTRLIVKNIPKHVDERRLRQHFSEKGEVSDAKIVRTKDGKSRQFGFIGFTCESDAEDALNHYHRTFLDTSRIQVEHAQPKGDAGIARPWSKHSEGSSRAQRLAEARVKRQERVGGTASAVQTEATIDAKDSKADDERKDLEKEEFMAALRKRSEARFWDNDDVVAAASAAPSKESDRTVRGAGGSSDSSGDEPVLSGDDDGPSEDNDASDASGSPASKHFMRRKEHAEGVSDMDWLRSKVGSKAPDDENETSGFSEGDESTGDDEAIGEQKTRRGDSETESEVKVDGARRNGPAGEEHQDKKSKEGEEEEEEDDTGLTTGRLFVRNLPYTTTEDDLRGLFEGSGLVSEVHLPVDDNHRIKGFAFVQFAIPEDAEKALERLDRHAFRGRLLHIIPARRQPGVSGAGGADASSSAPKSYKEQKERDRRARASDSTGWNASYVRADTVVDALADRLGVGKGDILDREEGDMAVRLALGETHLVKENKEYFQKEGVDISALESGKAPGGSRGAEGRSDTVILVKNLPYTTEASELAKRFGAYGDVGRVLLPPSRAVALVEFLAASDARKAFKRLAYTRFQHVPLYLEWAPVKAFGDTFKPSSKPAALPAPAKTAAHEGAKVDEDEIAAGRASEEPLTVYVKNLSFSTTEQGLRKCFESAGLGVRSVSIPRKKGKGHGDATLSMGFGFVEFVDKSFVDKTLKSLGGIILDGHALELKRSTKRLTQAAGGGDDVKRSKLIIRNVPFQATAKELRELFATFGQLKRVRLPKKFDGSHRGFAFVDFLTSQEALNAKTSLASTHIYGRHLVGEWAEDKDDVDTLRQKAAKDVRNPTGGGAGRAAKRRKAGAGDGFDGMGPF